MKNRILFSIITLFVATCEIETFAGETQSCGEVTKSTGRSQVIPEQGKIVSEVNSGLSVPCGSMLLTRQGTIWVKFENGSGVKVGPDSFIEVASDGEVTIHRGRALFQSPPQKVELIAKTPQAEVNWKGGAFWIEYLPSEKSTQVAVFNRALSFRNRFHVEAAVEVQAGKMSSITFNEPRVIPRAPRLLSVDRVKSLLSRLELTNEELAGIEEVIERVNQEKNKTLVSELENWRVMKRSDNLDRAPASQGEERPKASYLTAKERENEIAIRHLKAKLYEGLDSSEPELAKEEAPKEVQKVSRAPSSVSGPIEDPEYYLQKRKTEQEKDMVLKKLNQFKDE